MENKDIKKLNEALKVENKKIIPKQKCLSLLQKIYKPVTPELTTTATPKMLKQKIKALIIKHIEGHPRLIKLAQYCKKTLLKARKIASKIKWFLKRKTNRISSDSSLNQFYIALETAFRGSKEEIYARLQQYIPVLEQNIPNKSNARTLDIACGRGEWLELMSALGFAEVHGIDLNKQMIKQVSKNAQIRLHAGDAIKFLRKQKAQSFDLITSFHFIEHIDFKILHEMVYHTHRLLKPSGLLILETPNYECPIVSQRNFWIDPTHRTPIPEPLLVMLLKYWRYKEVHTHFINTVTDIDASEYDDKKLSRQSFNKNITKTMALDYCVIGIKS